MATSHEKLEQLQAELAGRDAGGDAGGPESMLALLMGQALPIIAMMLPDDPAQLDEQLTRCGDFIHALRSDDYTPPAAVSAPELASELASSGAVQPRPAA